jgi:FkbM family methyltransferase
LRHYFITALKILSSSYPYGKASLLYCYFKLLINSFLFHRKNHDDRTSSSTSLAENILGNTIRFFNYPELINLFEEIFIYQIYAFESEKKDPFIVDAGSNIGISVLYFKIAYPESRIIAVEPNRESFGLLKENIILNHLPFVTLLNYALSDTAGTSVLYNHPNQGSLTMSLLQSTGKSALETVTTKMLSSYIHNEIELMKLDVEGSEIKIVSDLIHHQKLTLVKKMIIEFHPTITGVTIDPFIETLSQNQFQCTFEKDSLHPKATEIIVHCTRDLQVS